MMLIQVRELEVKCEETRPVSQAKETLDHIAKRQCETLIIAVVSEQVIGTSVRIR